MESERKGTRGGWKARRRGKMRRSLLLLGVTVILGIGLLGRWIALRLAHGSHPLPQMIGGPSGSLYPDPPGIVLHASESPAVVNGVPINAAKLEEIHARDHPGWATVFEGKTYHIGYHYVILPDGTIEKGRPDHCIGCHAPTHNDWIGICVIGEFDPSGHKDWWPSKPTKEQIVSVVTLCKELMSRYHIPPENVWRHWDVKKTWCPGRRFPYKEIQQQLHVYAAAHPETRGVIAPRVVTARY